MKGEDRGHGHEKTAGSRYDRQDQPQLGLVGKRLSFFRKNRTDDSSQSDKKAGRQVPDRAA